MRTSHNAFADLGRLLCMWLEINCLMFIQLIYCTIQAANDDDNKCPFDILR